MNDYYRIKEIAQLYDLCTDTLRYYEEQGILAPIRARNNYRLYGIQDIYNLNIIRSLREVNIPLERIKDYLHNRSVATTFQLLSEEEQLIKEKIAKMQEMYEVVQKRTRELKTAAQQSVGEFRLIKAGPRPCFKLSEDVILERDIDFLLKKLEKKHEDTIHIIGNQQMGATLDVNYLRQGIYNHFSWVFFAGEDFKTYDALIPEGEYASTFYAGEYEKLAVVLPQLFEFVAKQNKVCDGAPMELYCIDIHATKKREEYLTEVQVKVRDK